MTASIKPPGKSCMNVENIYSSTFSFFSVKKVFTIDTIENKEIQVVLEHISDTASSTQHNLV